MRQLEYSPEATADLADIGAYIARDDPRRARSFVDELEARCAGLTEYPDSGRARPELAAGPPLEATRQLCHLLHARHGW